MGALCAQWFSDFLGRPLRLARFDPEAPRRADRKWTGDIEAANAFQDGFPLLVASATSIDEVNRRLASAGQAPVTLARFRPNLVLGGLDANGEDHLDEIVFATRRGAGAAASSSSRASAARSPTSIPPPEPPATRSATCCPATAPTRAWAGRSRSHERGRRRRRRSHADDGNARHGELRLRLRASAADAPLQDLAAVRDLRRRLGDDVARDHLPAVRLLGRGRRRRFASPSPAPACSRSAAGAACRSPTRSPTTGRSRSRASSSTASRTSASTTRNGSCRPGSSRSATRRRRCSPGVGAALLFGAAISRRFVLGGVLGVCRRRRHLLDRDHARAAAASAPGSARSSPSRRCCSRRSAA